MDVSGLSTGNFLSARDKKVGSFVTVKILNEGELQESDTYGKSIVFEVEADGENKKMRVSISNIEAIKGDHGTDTNKWIGNEMKFVVLNYATLGQKGFQYCSESN